MSSPTERNLTNGNRRICIHAAARPVPPGWDAREWYLAFNAADSHFYQQNGNSADGPAGSIAARESGLTRQYALDTPLRKAREAQQRRASSSHSARRGRNSTVITQSVSSSPILTQSVSTQTVSTQPAPRVAPESANMASPYPLTVAQSEETYENQHMDNAEFDKKVTACRAACREQHNKEVQECKEHAAQIRLFTRELHANNRPGRWYNYRPASYFEEINKMFDDPQCKLAAIQQRILAEWEAHKRDEICTVHDFDSEKAKAAKTVAARMFDMKQSLDEINDFMNNHFEAIFAEMTPKQMAFQLKLTACTTNVERYKLYQDEFCTEKPDDSEADKKLRVKWTGLYNQGKPFIEIVGIIKQDIADHLAQEKIDEMNANREISNKELARNRHVKDQLQKREKFAEKRSVKVNQAAKYFSMYSEICANSVCHNLCIPNLDTGVGPLLCSWCQSEHEQGQRAEKDQFFFCSYDCHVDGAAGHRAAAHPETRVAGDTKMEG